MKFQYSGYPQSSYCKGFTFVELMVALAVSAIILAAVATLAYAVGAANDAGDDTAWKQAQLRYATLRISRLIRYCKCIREIDHDLAVWRADDDGDGEINIEEIVFIEADPATHCLRFVEFSAHDGFKDNSFGRGEFKHGAIMPWAKKKCDLIYTVLVPECSNVEYLLSLDDKFASVSFDLVENGQNRHYQISATVRGWAGNLADLYGDDD